MWEILQGMLILRLYAITIEKKPNRLGGKNVCSVRPLIFLNSKKYNRRKKTCHFNHFMSIYCICKQAWNRLSGLSDIWMAEVVFIWTLYRITVTS